MLTLEQVLTVPALANGYTHIAFDGRVEALPERIAPKTIRQVLARHGLEPTYSIPKHAIEEREDSLWVGVGLMDRYDNVLRYGRVVVFRAAGDHAECHKGTRWTERLSQRQYDAALALAKAHEHLWAIIMRDFPMLPDRDGGYGAEAIRKWVRNRSQDPGIDAPTIVGSVVVHRSSGGRIGWEVDSSGNVTVTVYRPASPDLAEGGGYQGVGMPVASTTVPYGGGDSPVRVMGEVHQRHVKALLRMADAVQRYHSDMDWVAARSEMEEEAS